MRVDLRGVDAGWDEVVAVVACEAGEEWVEVALTLTCG